MAVSHHDVFCGVKFFTRKLLGALSPSPLMLAKGASTQSAWGEICLSSCALQLEKVQYCKTWNCKITPHCDHSQHGFPTPTYLSHYLPRSLVKPLKHWMLSLWVLDCLEKYVYQSKLGQQSAQNWENLQALQNRDTFTHKNIKTEPITCHYVSMKHVHQRY